MWREPRCGRGFCGVPTIAEYGMNASVALFDAVKSRFVGLHVVNTQFCSAGLYGNLYICLAYTYNVFYWKSEQWARDALAFTDVLALI